MSGGGTAPTIDPQAPGDDPSGDPVAPASGRRRVTVRPFAITALLVLLLGLPVLAGWVVLDAVDAGRSLVAARDGLADARRAIADVDLDRARDSVAYAEGHLETARERSGTWRWSLATRTPLFGSALATTRDVVDGASAITDVVSIAVAEGGALLVDGLGVGLVDGRLDLTPLIAAGEVARTLPVEPLQDARDRLAEPAAGWVPGPLRSARAEVLETAETTLDAVTRGQALTSALPGFLGADGPRRYFVGMQTSAELRGTGGLIGFWSVLAFDDGALGFGQSEVFEPDDDREAGVAAEGTATERIGQLGGPYQAGVVTDPAYLDRYARMLGASSFSNINLDPDLPTVARVALDLYQLRTGDELDGMVLLDPLGLQELLEATGDQLPVPARVDELLGTGDAIATGDFAELVTSDVYAALGAGRSSERKEALRLLGDAAFTQLAAGGWDPARMARAMVDASFERHLLLFSEVEAEQAAFSDVEVTGALPRHGAGDLLAITANNAVGGKQDVHLGHGFDVEVHLDDVRRGVDGGFTARRRSVVEVTVDNPLPTEGLDPYVIGNCVLPDGTHRCFEGPPGWNWTWFSTWLPADSEVVDRRTDPGATRPLEGPSRYRDFRVMDHVQSTPPQDRASFGLTYDGTTALELRPDTLVYEWVWWRQAKALPDLLDVTVHPPEGWTIVDVEVVGGGSGRGSGVNGDGRRLETVVADGTARLTGTVSADTRFRVHLGDG
jgi:hypothetical protein